MTIDGWGKPIHQSSGSCLPTARSATRRPAPAPCAQEDEAPAAHLSPADAACVADWGVTLTQEAQLVRQLREEIELELGRPLEALWGEQ